MKKKMVTMLMLGVMAVMTACGNGEKADTTKETADSEVQEESGDEEDLEEDTEDEKDENMIPESPDDVKIDYSAIYKGGETFTVNEIATYQDRTDSLVSTYENDAKKKLYHYSERYEGGTKISGANRDIYFNDNTGESWWVNQDTGEIRKYSPAPEVDLSTCHSIQRVWEDFFEHFNLPWEYASETEDTYVFEVKEENAEKIKAVRHDAASLLHFTDAWLVDTFSVKDFTASCTYSKKGLGILEMKIDVDYEAPELLYGTNEIAHYSFCLTGSNYGSTSVEIPEDIINNVVEEE